MSAPTTSSAKPHWVLTLVLLKEKKPKKSFFPDFQRWLLLPTNAMGGGGQKDAFSRKKEILTPLKTPLKRNLCQLKTNLNHQLLKLLEGIPPSQPRPMFTTA